MSNLSKNGRRVVVTGMGMLTPVGNDTASTWNALLAGKSGIAKITRFDASEFRSQIAGEVKNFEAEKWMDKKEVRKNDLFIQYALAAAEQAVQQSGLQVTEEMKARISIGCEHYLDLADEYRK